MKQLTDAQMQFLVVLNRACRVGLEPCFDNLLALGREKIGRSLLDWTDAIDCLITSGLLTKQGQDYSYTEEGKAATDEVMRKRPISYYWYNEYYLRAEKSLAHGRFLERVYGKNLCQHGIADMAQIDDLITTLNLGEKSRVLELGCGNGMITEYISDSTSAHITGMDIADKGIALARNRTRDKRERLTFDVGNMYALDYPDNSFDTIISIDTLYFVSDIESTLREVSRMLTRDGQMGLFFGSKVITVDSADRLDPDKTLLADALGNLGLEYTSKDFTESDYAHWKLKEQVLLEMKSEFEAENNMFLYDNRIAECAIDPDAVSGRRYLYHIKKRS